jgi:hypothetical protein
VFLTISSSLPVKRLVLEFIWMPTGTTDRKFSTQFGFKAKFFPIEHANALI